VPLHGEGEEKNCSKTLPATAGKSHRRSAIITTASCHCSPSRQQHREKQKEKTETEENRVGKNKHKEKEEQLTTVQVILQSATAGSTALRATAGQPSSPYLLLLFIFLHAERALCTFCKQENN
jgi:hypothetical protein